MCWHGLTPFLPTLKYLPLNRPLQTDRDEAYDVFVRQAHFINQPH